MGRWLALKGTIRTCTDDLRPNVRRMCHQHNSRKLPRQSVRLDPLQVLYIRQNCRQRPADDTGTASDMRLLVEA